MDRLNGFLVINKPTAWTSHDVVAKIKNTLHVKKAGHGGTLDPTATGVLVVLLDDYTKEADSFLGLDKSYRIHLEFGRSTTTGDETGETREMVEVGNEKLGLVTAELVQNALGKMTGVLLQKAPWFSAIKIGGKKLYQYARGKSPEELEALDKEIDRPVRDIEIYHAELVDFAPGTVTTYPSATVEISCSSGTYTRVFVEDLGKTIGVPAYQTSLMRTCIGGYTLENAVEVEHFGDREYLQNHIQLDIT